MYGKINDRGGSPLGEQFKSAGPRIAPLRLCLQPYLQNRPVTLDNLPHLSDVAIYTEILTELGATIDWNGDR